MRRVVRFGCAAIGVCGFLVSYMEKGFCGMCLPVSLLQAGVSRHSSGSSYIPRPGRRRAGLGSYIGIECGLNNLAQAQTI